MQQENQGVALSLRVLRVHQVILHRKAMDLHLNLHPAAINLVAFQVHQNPREAVLQVAAPLNHLQEDISLEDFQALHLAVEAAHPAVKTTAAPSEALYQYQFLGAQAEVMVTHPMAATAVSAL